MAFNPLKILTGTKQKQKTEGKAKTTSLLESLTEQAQQTESTKTATSAVTGATTAQQQQTSREAQEQIQAGTQKGTGATTQEQTQFGESTLQLLESLFAKSAGDLGGSQERQQALAGLASSQATDFDAEQFVADTVRAAESRFSRQNEESLNVLSSSIGGTARDNSAAALLSGKLAEESRASLAGIRANAAATGAQIQGANITRAAGLEQFNAQNLSQLGALLKGGRTAGAGTTLTGQETTGTQRGITTGTQAGTSAGTSVQETTAVESILELINSLTQATAEEVSETEQEGTVTTTGRGSLLDALGQIANIGSTVSGFGK